MSIKKIAAFILINIILSLSVGCIDPNVRAQQRRDCEEFCRRSGHVGVFTVSQYINVEDSCCCYDRFGTKQSETNLDVVTAIVSESKEDSIEFKSEWE
jgi:hypothetical protein